MKLHFSIDQLKGIKRPVVTTGTFDGVHIGHKAIINRLIKLAKDIDGETVLITFHPHPRRVLYPDSEGKDLQMILSQKEKIELLRQTGLDHLCIVEFTKEFSQISSHDFVQKILVDILHAKIVVVGFNHQFGYRREGDFEYLYNLSRSQGFEVEEIPEQDIQHESVSSTKIRKALLSGNIQRANAYLDHLYIIRGKLSVNNKSKEIPGFYNLNIEEDTKLIPPGGVYAITLINNNITHKGLVTISDGISEGNIISSNIKIEVNIFDENERMNGKEVNLFFQKKIRDFLYISDTETLRNQLEKDRAEIEELIF